VEGAEWQILQSIPWSLVDIKVLMVENAHLGEDNHRLETFMVSQGYDIKEKIGGQDTVFLKKSW